MRALCAIAVLFLTVGSGGEGWAEDAIGTRPLLTIARNDLPAILQPDCHILIDLIPLNSFLMPWMGALRTGVWSPAMAITILASMSGCSHSIGNGM